MAEKAEGSVMPVGKKKEREVSDALYDSENKTENHGDCWLEAECVLASNKKTPSAVMT